MGSGASLSAVKDKATHLNIADDLLKNVQEECVMLHEMVLVLRSLTPALNTFIFLGMSFTSHLSLCIVALS